MALRLPCRTAWRVAAHRKEDSADADFDCKRYGRVQPHSVGRRQRPTGFADAAAWPDSGTGTCASANTNPDSGTCANANPATPDWHGHDQRRRRQWRAVVLTEPGDAAARPD